MADFETPELAEDTPRYVHRLLDAYLYGGPLDFKGAGVPKDVQDRLEKTFRRKPSPEPDTPLPQIGKRYLRVKRNKTLIRYVRSFNRYHTIVYISTEPNSASTWPVHRKNFWELHTVDPDETYDEDCSS